MLADVPRKCPHHLACLARENYNMLCASARDDNIVVVKFYPGGFPSKPVIQVICAKYVLMQHIHLQVRALLDTG